MMGMDGWCDKQDGLIVANQVEGCALVGDWRWW